MTEFSGFSAYNPVYDEIDNCQYDSNPSQEDFDQDGLGDECDTDDDSDGVSDGDDQCQNTPLGELVNSTGCSIAEICPCDNEWKNHGKYVSCVAHAANDFLEEGLITEEEKDTIVSDAAESDCGKK